jgi:hypothetical protein
MPACGPTRQCPGGFYGSTCNVLADGRRILPSKQRICLLGYCTGPQDCLTGQHCVLEPGNPYGGCYSGTTGSPCNSSQDCALDAGCTIPADAGIYPGTCQ